MTAAAVEAPVRPDGILQMLAGFQISQLLMTAVRLRLFDWIHQEPSASAALCHHMGIPHASGLRFLKACAAAGLVRHSSDRWRNSPMADVYLVSGKPTYLGRVIDYYADHQYETWRSLLASVRSGRPFFDAVGPSASVFSEMKGNSALLRSFLSAMHGWAAMEAGLLAGGYAFGTLRTVTDVGGGSGANAIALAKAFPNLRIHLMDVPEVCHIANEYVTEATLPDRITLHPGDFFTDPIPPAEAILLSMILHDWDDASCGRLLRRCAAALPANGELLVFEQWLNADDEGPLRTRLTDLTMLLSTPSGRERTIDEYRALLVEAGFDSPEARPLPGARQLLVAKKAAAAHRSIR